VALWDTKSANLKVWTQTQVMCESFPSPLLTPLTCTHSKDPLKICSLEGKLA